MAPPNSTVRNNPDICGFTGEPDFYGLGIRLGIYLQWTSVLVIKTFNLRGRGGLAKSYVIFIFAIFIALLVMTAQTIHAPKTDPSIAIGQEQPDDGQYSVEVLILTYIIFGGVYIMLLTGNKPPQIQRFDIDALLRLVRQFVFWCVLTAASVYCIWFWLWGIQSSGFKRTPRDDKCTTYGFLFARVPLYDSRVTGFFAACSIFATFGWIWGFVVYCLAVAPSVLPMRNESYLSRVVRFFDRLNRAQSQSKDWHRNPKQEKAERIVQVVIPYLRAFSLVYSILGIELTLHWNDVTGVYDVNTTGQLIPFTIGLCGLVQILYVPLLEVSAPGMLFEGY
ncbi:hypothetical protein FALBO_4435 [Fusarium albosuccineum]|uniref:Uncharacterized protein n=1 Tax=Fusarium albosuccineum TaxID=1237068 RepID=A0A8H4LFG4_9HYPO|nr:hypothetical protein FALBO_4435 [Fusarium albosuccineum]